MPDHTILVIEDEEDIQELLLYILRKEGYQAVAVDSGERGLEAAIRQHPDLVILDLMLPGMDGLSVCRQLKSNENTRDIRVIIVSAKGEESDIVAGLELGADDYITKPFTPGILLARIRAVLRRNDRMPDDGSVPLTVHELSLDPKKFKVRLAGEPVELTTSEFRILHFLASRRGWVFTRDQIISAIRGEGYVVTERAIDVAIAGLRKKLGEYSSYIETVRGVGYRFTE
jgi:two-component system phosphate regulon response regulator PhoB